MWLGRGFNSFTQQICIDNAVRAHTRDPSDGPEIKDDPAGVFDIDRGVSQIDTYSSRFVDKLSDVTGISSSHRAYDPIESNLV